MGWSLPAYSWESLSFLFPFWHYESDIPLDSVLKPEYEL